MFERLREYLERTGPGDEIAALTERDLAEIGVTRDALRIAATAPREVTERMTAMAFRHGLVPDDFDSYRADVAGLVESCAGCASLGACRAYLADADAPASEADFCPNHVTYAALAAAREA
jgi:hypothetical protein